MGAAHNRRKMDHGGVGTDRHLTLQPYSIARVILHTRLMFEQTDLRGVRNRALDAEEIAP